MRAQVIVLANRIESRIFLLRGQKVMLSPDLANLYDVQLRALVQAVKRNIERFPADFMFQLSAAEFRSLKSQIVTSSWAALGAPHRTPSPNRESPCSRASFIASAPS